MMYINHTDPYWLGAKTKRVETAHHFVSMSISDNDLEKIMNNLISFLEKEGKTFGTNKTLRVMEEIKRIGKLIKN